MRVAQPDAGGTGDYAAAMLKGEGKKMSDLDDLLNGDETPVTEEVETTETVETPETEVEAKGEETVESPATEQQETTPIESGLSVEDLQKQVQGLRAGLMAERQKRQELENQHNNSPEVKSAQEEEFWQDPRGSVQQMVGGMLRENAVNTTDAILSETVPDYQDMRNYYMQKAQSDPTLLQNAGNHSNPALYIYKTAKQMKEVEEIGSLDTWKATEKAKIEQDFEERVKEGIKQALEQKETLNGSAGDLRATQNKRRRTIS